MTSRLDATRRHFIKVWGEMASSWGVSRTMAQIYALLFALEEPLDTDAIMTELEISRGNANMNLHKLLNWGLVHKVTKLDTRKDFFEAEKDVWNLTRNIIEQRQRLELKPVTESLDELASQIVARSTSGSGELAGADRAFYDNLRSMSEFLRLFNEAIANLTPLLSQKNPEQIRLLVNSLQFSEEGD